MKPKRKLKKVPVCMLLFFITAGVYGAQFHSTPTGGNWSNPLTWVENMVPGTNDSVYVMGPGAVSLNVAATSCRLLAVYPGGIFRNYAGGNYNFTINGNVLNQGTITNSSGSLYLYITGDIIHQGIWNNHTINLTGSTGQTISCDPGCGFACTYFYDLDGSTPVNALTAITFSGTTLNFNGASFITQPSPSPPDLLLKSSTLTNVNVLANQATLLFAYDSKMGAGTTIENAVIEGTAIVQSSITFNGTTVVEDTLRNWPGGNYTLSVNGKIINHGLIMNSSGYLYTHLTGDMDNFGVCDNHTLLFNGSGPHYINAAGGLFSTNYFTVQAASGPVYALSGLAFEGSTIDFNNDTLYLPSAKTFPDTMTLNNVSLLETVVVGHNNYLVASGGGHAGDYVSLHDLILQGTLILDGSNNRFNGSMTLEGTLRNMSGTNPTVTVSGHFYNQGSIVNSSGSLYMYVAGDIDNFGLWDNFNLQLSGTGPQYINAPTGIFSMNYFSVQAASGPVYALSGLSFSDCAMDFNNDTLYLREGLPVPDTLRLNNCSFVEAVVMGYDNCLSVTGGGYIGNLMTVNDMILTGTLYLNGSNNALNGTIRLEGILQNYPGTNSIVTVQDSLYNHGIIQNNSGNLTVYLAGNLVNEGSFTCYRINLSGTGDQHVVCLTGHPFAVSYFEDVNSSSRTVADGDLLFIGTIVDLNNAELVMPLGKKLSISGIGRLAEFIVTGQDFELALHQGAYLSYGTCQPNAIITGKAIINGTVNFQSYIIIADSLLNYPGANVILNVGGRITNNGRIYNASGNLTINCQGDVINNGTWINFQTNLNGAQNQFIFLIGHQPIAGNVRFIVTGNSPYQWYYNGAVLNSPDFTGETSATLNWAVPVQQSWYGVYYCMTGSGQSRTFTVGGGMMADFRAYLEGPFNGTDMNTTLNADNLIPLGQPYNTAPWNYSGTESVTAIPNADVVDWLLVELRETTGGSQNATSATMVAQMAAFLLKDGTITGLDGQTELMLNLTITQNLYVVIWHRNHLGIQSANAVTMQGAAYTYDFSDNINKALGGSLGYKDLGPVCGMIAGNGDGNKQVNNADKLDVWMPQAGSSGYLGGDFNMNKQVNNQDKVDYWKINSGKGSQVVD
jgi:hypothetical protein